MPSPPDLSRIPRLDGSLCGCTLETAAKIIGFADLIACSVMFIFGLIYIGSLLAGWKDENFSYFYLGETDIIYYFVLSNIFKGYFAVYLLLGVYKGKPSYVKIWVFVQGFFILISLFLLIGYLFLLIIAWHFYPYSIVELVFLAIRIYFTLLVYSYYRNQGAGSIINHEI